MTLSRNEGASTGLVAYPVPGFVAPSAYAASDEPAVVTDLEVTILSTMFATPGIGERGFAAPVEADGHRIQFDTRARPGTVLEYARVLGIDLTNVTDVFLSHNHGDHTGDLVSLRSEVRESSRDALLRAHVGRGIF